MLNEEVVKFKYPAAVDDRYIYRGVVDNHNTLRHDGGNNPQIGLNSVWGTTWWTI